MDGNKDGEELGLAVIGYDVGLVEGKELGFVVGVNEGISVGLLLGGIEKLKL